MNLDRLFVRMAIWLRRPPSRAVVLMGVGIIVFALILYGIEQIWGWPEALTPGPRPRVPMGIR